MARFALVALLCTALCAIGPPAAAAAPIDPGRVAPAAVMNANNPSHVATVVAIGTSSSMRLVGRDSPSMLGDRPADGALVARSSVLLMSMTAISAVPGADSS